MFESFGDYTSESVLDCLQIFHLRRVNVVENWITVIELGMNKRGGCCARGLAIKYYA